MNPSHLHASAAPGGVRQARGTVRLVKSFSFEAAHHLPAMPAGHKCRRLHGHSFKVDVVCEGNPDPTTGVLIDFGDIKAAFEPLHDVLDHYCLNDVPGLENPTSEVLSVWIWDRLRPTLPALAQIVVHETCTSMCIYGG